MAEPSTLDTVLIVRPVRDADGRLVDGEIEYANDAWRTTFSPGVPEPVGSRMLAIFPGMEHDPRWTTFVDAVEHGVATRLILPHPAHPDKLGELRVVPIDGRVLYTSHDATETQRAQAELAASEARYRELAEHVFDGILVLGPDRRLRSANRRAAEILGVPTGDLAAMEAIQQRTWHSLPADVQADSARRLDAGEVVTGDAPVIRADGVPIVVEQRARRRSDGSVVSMVRDVTALRKAEEAEHDRLVHEARTEALGQLAGGVAHDLNNHLTSVLGYAELALGDMGSPDQLARDLRQIIAASERAQEVTRRLLAFGRRSMLRPAVVDLADVLTAVEPTLRHVAGNRLALIVGPAAGLPPVRVDQGMLERALVALVENARDAMEGRGVLGITTGRSEETDGLPTEDWACIRIEDTGVGMDQRALSLAFEPFAPGSAGGLGLPMVQGFMDQSGGHLRIRTAPGEGTVVSLFLPFTDADVMAPEIVLPPVAAADGHAGGDTDRAGDRPATVLVVDDEEFIRSIAERVLGRAGYDVLTAVSGEDALQVAATADRAIDLLLTDVVMPGMHGIALANVLRRQRPDLRIVITSGYGEDEVDRAGVTGDAGFLPKPYSPADLVRVVERVLAVAD